MRELLTNLIDIRQFIRRINGKFVGKLESAIFFFFLIAKLEKCGIIVTIITGLYALVRFKEWHDLMGTGFLWNW